MEAVWNNDKCHTKSNLLRLMVHLFDTDKNGSMNEKMTVAAPKDKPDRAGLVAIVDAWKAC